MIAETDLIINPDGSIYHLNLLPGDLAETIITVGDPDRVALVSKYFDKIELKKGKREFLTHTGYISNKRISVISTGIGTDNIDIVFNELDALFNIDFKTRAPKKDFKALFLIRIGTSGGLHPDIETGSVLASAYGLGLDTLMHFYEYGTSIETEYLLQKITSHLGLTDVKPYLFEASTQLLKTLAHDMLKGITVTVPGFYGPQGRQLNAKNNSSAWVKKLSSFEFKHHKLTNLEMETAGIYALADVLSHHALSINLILANRQKGEFAKNPEILMENTIKMVLDRIVQSSLT